MLRWLKFIIYKIRIKRYIKKNKGNLATFAEIKMYPKVISAYEYLKKFYNKNKYVTSFEIFYNDILCHNEKIKNLKEKFDNILLEYPIEKIIESFGLYTVDDIRAFDEVAVEIMNYTIPDSFEKKKEYSEYALKIGRLLNEYNSVFEQIQLVKKLNAIESGLEDKYYDNRDEYIVTDKIRKIMGELSEKAGEFVAMPVVDDFFVKKHNDSYIDKHLNDEIFSDINGKVLDKEQRKAILCDSRSNLVIAGAGSGKTLTICGKVKWLLTNGYANPSEVLLLSYSKASADDLAKKVSKISDELKVKTFHSLGLEILNSDKGDNYAVEDQFEKYMREFFLNEILKSEDLYDLFFTYCSEYAFSTEIDNKKYEDIGEKYKELKSLDLKTLKQKSNELSDYKKQTLKREFVKSCEELVIANWLFVNGIKYEYESPYQYQVATNEYRQYTPDFYLPDYDIYIEHYGIDRNGHTPQYSQEEEAKYIDGIKWKRELHERYNTTCIETYSYEFADGSLLQNLEQKLKNIGVSFHPLQSEEIKKYVEMYLQESEFDSLFRLVTTFISLYKARYTDGQAFEFFIDELSKHYKSVISTGEKGSSFSAYETKRQSLFLEICLHAYNYYISQLRESGKIDFDDMILKAVDTVENSTGYKYKYIIVDEFQDISYSRNRFLHALIKHGDSKLFAVGDDWQAIYRFAGCDINIFLKFNDLFEGTTVNYITSTHRNSQELQDIVGPFITKNPEQLKKKIKSELHEKRPVRILFHDSDREEALISVLDKIGKTNPNAEVLVLARNRHDIDSVNCADIIIKEYKEIIYKAYPEMRINYKTVHQSKGLESDYVILISGEDARNGFPNKIEDDSVLNFVLDKRSDYMYAEERRLFYVALTRTRSVVYVLSDIEKPSEFVLEIRESAQAFRVGENKNVAKGNMKCPVCGSGRLVLRTNGGKSFYGCSNFPFCNYTISDLKAVEINNRCPQCGDFLVVRKGKNGNFIGCHGYPFCKYTRNIFDKD